MRISDWSSDVCSSDLYSAVNVPANFCASGNRFPAASPVPIIRPGPLGFGNEMFAAGNSLNLVFKNDKPPTGSVANMGHGRAASPSWGIRRSEEHTSELQSLMRISYAVFCLKTKNNT